MKTLETWSAVLTIVGATLTGCAYGEPEDGLTEAAMEMGITGFESYETDDGMLHVELRTDEEVVASDVIDPAAGLQSIETYMSIEPPLVEPAETPYSHDGPVQCARMTLTPIYWCKSDGWFGSGDASCDVDGIYWITGYDCPSFFYCELDCSDFYPNMA